MLIVKSANILATVFSPFSSMYSLEPPTSIRGTIYAQKGWKLLAKIIHPLSQ